MKRMNSMKTTVQYELCHVTSQQVFLKYCIDKHVIWSMLLGSPGYFHTQNIFRVVVVCVCVFLLELNLLELNETFMHM